MGMIVKVTAQAEKGQERMEEEFEASGVIRIPSTTPSWFLVAADDVEELVAIAATYRTKPRVVEAGEEDVPQPGATDVDTDLLVDLIHRVGYTFNWDDDTRLWCVSGLRDGFTDEPADAPARNRRVAAIEAIRYLVS